MNNEEYWKGRFSGLAFTLAAILSSLPEKQAIYKDIDIARFGNWKDIKFSTIRDELNKQTIVILEN